jgi:carbonic anhydrase
VEQVTSQVGLSRRSFIGKSLAASGVALVGGVVAACGDSGSSSSASSTTSTTPVNNPDQALARLLDGNKRFVSGNLDHPRRDDVQRAEQAEGQTPFAIILGCADSRVPPEIVFDEGLGDLFSVRVAGNTASDDIVVGSIEYAAAVLECVLLVVLGHGECGAVKATIDQVTKGKQAPGHIDALLQPIVPAVEAVKATAPDQLLDAAIRENVRHTVSLMQSSQPVLAPLVQAGKLKVVGAEYELHSGRVDVVQ